MTISHHDMHELHWLMEMMQNIDAGLFVIDREYRVQSWNNFMEAHSGLRASQVQGQPLNELFDNLPWAWLKRKVDNVFSLNIRAFTHWEQRAHVFAFKNYRPITGTSTYMYQNITLSPLNDLSGRVSHVCFMLYDVTDTAVYKLKAQAIHAELAKQSRTDALTQLNNRGYWEDRLEQEFNRTRRSGHPVSLVMIDIDHFKQINDNYGHQVGDKIICLLSTTIANMVRKSDIAGRYGGEEFGIILIDSDATAAHAFCERLRLAIERLEPTIDEALIPFTISLGVAPLDETMSNAEQWIAQADKALYQSKSEGRNKTSVV